MSSLTFLIYFLIISIGLTLDLFYLSIFGKVDPNPPISHFFLSSSILLTRSINPAYLVPKFLTDSSTLSILLLLTFKIELFLNEFKLPWIDGLKLLLLSRNVSRLDPLLLYPSSSFDDYFIVLLLKFFYFIYYVSFVREFYKVFSLFL